MHEKIWLVSSDGILLRFAIAAENPDWAYPATPSPRPSDTSCRMQMPGSAKNTRRRRSTTGFNPPDWFSDEHPADPEIVAIGKKAGARLRALPSSDG